MTRWEVVASRVDAWGHGQTWAVVKVVDGEREAWRARWENLSCVEAQALAADLNGAYELGQQSMQAWVDAAELAAERLSVFGTSLAD